MKTRWLLMACLALCPSLLAAANGGSTLPAPPRPDDVPPQLLGNDRAGHPVDLANYHGKVAIVTFWASWCGYCRRELPVLDHFQDVIGRDALEVIAVNDRESRSEFLAMIRANRKLELTWVYDPKGRTSDQYGIDSLPHMFVLDRTGKVAFVHKGYSQDDLPGIIEEVLSLLPDEVKQRPAGALTSN